MGRMARNRRNTDAGKTFCVVRSQRSWTSTEGATGNVTASVVSNEREWFLKEGRSFSGKGLGRLQYSVLKVIH